jgi:hypothetical protein
MMGVFAGIVTASAFAQTQPADPFAGLPKELPPHAADDPAVQPYAPFNQPGNVNFDDFFVNKAIRLEFCEVGDAREMVVTLQKMFEEPLWPENPRFLIPPFEVGKCALKMYDAATNKLIYAHGFDTMYAEYSTTTPALNGVKHMFERSLHVPEPKKPVKIVYERRDKANLLIPRLAFTLDPADYHIIKENPPGDTVFEIQNSGDSHTHLDFLFLSEGYAAGDKDKFNADVRKMSDFMFTVEPYKSARDRISIRGIFRASPERGVDEPRQRSFKNTLMDASYNTFDLDRYLLVEDDFTMHRLAAQAPYDALIILVNSNRYGGGSIALDYCVASVDGPGANRIMVHELGHSFAFLADEYAGDVAYNDMYPKGVEPLEPNITELLDPPNIKWKSLLTPGIALPSAGNNITQVGAFEGAGYLTKGMYRPQPNCWMGNAGRMNGFCPVCIASLSRVIDYYSDPLKSATQPATSSPTASSTKP